MIKYKLDVQKDISDLTEEDMKNLYQDFEIKFLEFKNEVANDISYLDALIEYSDKFEFDVTFIGELTSYSKIISDRIKRELEKSIDIKDDEW